MIIDRNIFFFNDARLEFLQMPYVGLIAAQKASSSGVLILSAVKVPSLSFSSMQAGEGRRERITY